MVIIFCNNRNQNIIANIFIGNRIVITDVRSNLSEIFIKYLSHRFGVVNDIILFAKNYVFFKILFRIDKRFDRGPKIMFFCPPYHLLRSIDAAISILTLPIYYVIFYNVRSFLDKVLILYISQYIPLVINFLNSLFIYGILQAFRYITRLPII